MDTTAPTRLGSLRRADIERAAKAAWVAHNGNDAWAHSVVDDVFSPADDWPEEAQDMERVALAVIASLPNHSNGRSER
ncbi:hypothetical protein [Microbacterium sp.]|uniref:hypothetical protein n=1 Tax=Microbacterium sp. TaxID=51671 RepID=UPI003242D02E